MPGVERGVVGQLFERFETLVHRLRIRSGQIHPPASIQKERVSRNELAGLVSLFDVEALASRCMSRRMNQADRDATEFEHIAAFVANEIAL